MEPTTIARVEAFAVRLPRDTQAAEGTAGSPAPLVDQAGARYRRAATYPTVYSSHLETMLVRVQTVSGVVGWGEAQAPVAPEIARTIVDTLLAPLLADADALAPEALWQQMYSAMRVRGHTGGFLLDAIAAIDIALWDICGQVYGQPVYRLLGGPCRERVPCYVSGLTGSTLEEQVAAARALRARGFKVFLSRTEDECLATVAALRDTLGPEPMLAVDALWRLDVARAVRFARALARFDVRWLEAPLVPEDVRGHGVLARRSPVPIAIGESYRTRFEVRPFFEHGAVGVLQPDLGRSGLTEARKLAVLADTYHVPVAPHVSVGLGPQIAAALHFAAAIPNLLMLECNPLVYDVASRMSRPPLAWGVDSLVPPDRPGLGIAVDEAAIHPYLV